MSVDTVNDIAPRIQYVASASQTDFDYPFPIFADEDLVVDVNGVIKALDTDYTVSGEGDDNGGTVTFLVGRDADDIVTIYRDIPIERTTDFQQNGPYSSDDFNDELDRLTMIMQQLESSVGRSLRFPQTAEVTDAETTFSPLASWTDKYVYINADGIPEPAESIGSTTLSKSVINDYINDQSTVESGLGYTPSDTDYPSDQFGAVFVERYGALGNGSNDDYTAINRALLVMAAAGGGDVLLHPGSTYKIGTTLTIPENVRLCSFGYHGQPDDLAAVIKPTNAVSVGIDDAGANRRGLGIRGIVVDMSNMPNGSTGVRFSGVHQFVIDGLGIYGLPDATSIGLHLRGDATSGFGTLYGQIYNLNISTDALDRGVGVVCESVGADKANALMFVGARVAHLTTGWKFIGTGSGILCLNCNSESHAGNGVEVTNTTSGTHVRWIGGEVNANGGWGFTGSGGRVVTDATMGSNSSGDVDTATLTVGARILLSNTGPAYELDGVFLRTDKGLIVGVANQTITASDTIAADAGKKRLTASGPIVMSSNPQIADGSGNQILTLIGTSNTNTITLVNGNGLKLKSGIVLRANDTITLMYDSGGSNDWVELARNKQDNVVTFTNADATPSVADGNVFKTNGTTTITMFDDGEVGKTIKIRAGANIQITASSTLKLAGGANYSMTADDTLTLTMYDSGTWTEDARSVNA